jgi:predicted dehydrogenase
VAAANDCVAAADPESLLAGVDAVSIAVPTEAHHEVGMAALAAGKHVLMEKPLAADAVAGRALVAEAERRGLLLQVGHLERFNPVFEDVRSVVCEPKFMECHRLSPFAGRGGDTSVIYDVMIHDLDLIAFLVGRELESVEAVGVPVLSNHVDIANARLRFEGGCVANVTASRVSLKRERKLRVFQSDAYLSIDFDERGIVLARRSGDGKATGLPAVMEDIQVEQRNFAGADPLGDEVAAFVHSVRTGEPPRVSGKDGLIALELAERVLAALEESGA